MRKGRTFMTLVRAETTQWLITKWDAETLTVKEGKSKAQSE